MSSTVDNEVSAGLVPVKSVRSGVDGELTLTIGTIHPCGGSLIAALALMTADRIAWPLGTV